MIARETLSVAIEVHQMVTLRSHVDERTAVTHGQHTVSWQYRGRLFAPDITV